MSGFVEPVEAQQASCPDSPTTYGNGVIEGPVTGSGKKGLNSALGATLSGDFIVFWQTPTHGTFPSQNEMFALRFDDGGSAMCDPTRLSFLPIGSTGVDHVLPSVKVTANGVVIAAWTAKGGSSQQNALEVVVLPGISWVNF